jgi:RNA polymerase sigma factor (sigma-70 family)
MADDTHSTTDDLQALLVAARAGDSRAYAEFLKGITPLIRAGVSSAIPVAQRDDVVQEILLSVHRALPTYDAKRALRPWLNAIINYRKMDHLRSLYSRNSEIVADVETDFANQLVTNPTTAGELKDISRGIAQLSEKQRQVVELLRIRGYSVEETARMLGITPADVKVSAHRAAVKLKEMLDG